MNKIAVLSIIGTRPEAIKMAPVVKELATRSEEFSHQVCVTAQHREMLDQVLDLFGISPHYDLDIMRGNQNLSEITARILTALDPVLKEVRPDWVLVQGDTTTTMAGSLGAFYNGVRIGHVEAGLRTRNPRAPFPEEINRRITSVVADLHFAPTERSKLALLTEGVSADRIVVTGNTVIDALLWVSETMRSIPPNLPGRALRDIQERRLILVTGHRRESFGFGFEQICRAIREIVRTHPDTCVIYPVHLNPNVQEPVHRILGGIDRVHLLDPLAYASFVWLMEKAYLILTDSGGIQEEAPALGKPVLVMRDVTERPEGVEAGSAVLVGVEQTRIAAGVSRLLRDSDLYRRMSQTKNPYGDGSAAARIVQAIRDCAK
jgi:UDP-N-acetylglucosamine 2-epimerase (non-hydrolysing)